jgi:Protein of unknown function (DUF1559)
VACSGSNADGNALTGNGIFYGVNLDVAKNAGVSVVGITDGTSNTVAFSETLLGAGVATTATADVKRYYKQASPLTQANCDASTTFVMDRSFLWADGAYNCTLYHNVRTPNSSQFDCVQHSNPAWKAARSQHEQGVNALLGDGSVRFVRDSVDPVTWIALGSRNGREIVGDY